MKERHAADKLARLREYVHSLGGAAVAFSGGLDSALVAAVAFEESGGAAAALTARGPLFPARELREAEELARARGWRHEFVDVDPFAVAGFAANPPQRCYLCKQALFGKLASRARELGFARLLDGANADDVRDYRPGLQAARELGVISPLLETGFTKPEISAAARELGLPVWDKPAAACLASRIPCHETITPEKLRQVEAAEEFLRELGLRQCRVRHHGDTARIETPPDDFARVVLPARERICAELERLGFRHVALDLRGYRSGSLNP